MWVVLIKCHMYKQHKQYKSVNIVKRGAISISNGIFLKRSWHDSECDKASLVSQILKFSRVFEVLGLCTLPEYG